MSWRDFFLLLFCVQAIALPMPRALVLRVTPAVEQGVVERTVLTHAGPRSAAALGDEREERAPGDDAEDGAPYGASAPDDDDDDRPPQPPSGEEDDLIHSGYDPMLHPTQPAALSGVALPPAPPHLERPPRPPAA